MDKLPTIGALRFPLTIYKRYDTPDPAGTGMISTLTDPIETVGDVVPTGPVTFFGSVTADYEKPVTHRIFIRWMTPFDSNFDLNYQINRTLNTPDSRQRTEVFRVWRFMELNGRQRFIQFDCQLETITST